MIPTVTRVTWTQAEFAQLDRDWSQTTNFGGFQTLIAKAVQRTNRTTLQCDVFPQDVERAERYLTKYGKGTYNTLAGIVLAAYRRAVKK